MQDYLSRARVAHHCFFKPLIPARLADTMHGAPMPCHDVAAPYVSTYVRSCCVMGLGILIWISLQPSVLNRICACVVRVCVCVCVCVCIHLACTDVLVCVCVCVIQGMSLYKKLVDTGASTLTWATHTTPYKLGAQYVYPLVQPIADPAVDKIASSKLVQETLGYWKPVAAA